MFCVTIDVEPDCTVSWRRSNPLSFVNVTTGIVEILQPLFARQGVRPTYLLSPEVLDHAPAVAALRGLTDCELGTHLHAEYIGPARTYADAAGTESAEFPCNLPDDVEDAKIAAITELFTRQIGRTPRSYRAARFGADEHTFASLARQGYKVDTSVTPGINWGRAGGPDFRGRPEQPYWLEPDRLLEVPVTISGKRLPGLPDKWLFHRWLRPSIMSVHEMKRLIDRQIDTYGDDTVLNMMFHSMEVIPLASPYVRSAAGQRRFLRRLAAICEYVVRAGFVGRTLEELYDARR
jgi:hypothetical protein